jgi:hypothetical protein
MGLEFKAVTDGPLENIGGIPCKIYYAPHGDIAAYPKLPALDGKVGMDSLVQLTSLPVFHQGKCYYPIDVTLEKGALSDDDQGELGGKSFKTTLKFNLNGKTPNNLGFARLSSNCRMTFMVPDEDMGAYFTPGILELHPCMRSTGKVGTGEGPVGKKGHEYIFECTQSSPTPYMYLTDEQKAALLTPAA